MKRLPKFIHNTATMLIVLVVFFASIHYIAIIVFNYNVINPIDSTLVVLLLSFGGSIIFIYFLRLIYLWLLNAFDDFHGIINVITLLIVTVAASLVLYYIKGNRELELLVHLTLIMIVLSLLTYIIDTLMVIKKQNKFINYKIIRQETLFKSLNNIYKSFNIIASKPMSKLEKKLLDSNLYRISGAVQLLSKSKYETDFGAFKIFWNDLMETLENSSNEEIYRSITDFTQNGNVKPDRLEMLKKDTTKSSILHENVVVQKLFIFDSDCKTEQACTGSSGCDVHKKNSIYCTQSETFYMWKEISDSNNNNVEVKFIEKHNLPERVKGKNTDIGIFGDIVVGYQLSDDYGDGQTAGDILSYIFYFDDTYINESIGMFNDTWEKAKQI